MGRLAKFAAAHVYKSTTDTHGEAWPPWGGPACLVAPQAGQLLFGAAPSIVAQGTANKAAKSVITVYIAPELSWHEAVLHARCIIITIPPSPSIDYACLMMRMSVILLILMSCVKQLIAT
jgi:hypothetical protein